MISQTSYTLDTSKILAQRQFMQSISRELLYSGAFGAGKSRIGCEKGYYLSIKYPQNRGLIVRKTYTDLRDTTMDTWFRYVMPEEHLLQYYKQEHRVVLKNGSEILFHGLDSPTKIGSLEVGWIFVDEAIEFSEEEWRMLLGRLRHPLVPFHQIFAATNPGDPQHWLYKHFYLDMELKRNKVTEVFESDALSNPFTPQGYKDSLNTFKGRYKERFVQGKWISFAGLVFDNWDPSKHIKPRDTKDLGLTGDPAHPIPADWERFRAIDFGFTNPFVCGWFASPTHK
jgi:PBSX family phage terminase large subunit